jgi:hypothetical protein
MKRILFLLLTVFSLSAGAQVYNNEWIDYNKTYYKFKIGANGLFRISGATLATIGLENTNADHFQLWRNGEEVPVYTSVRNAPLGPGGFIEFWGEMNDGKPDLPLYREPDYQLNDKWSLQTDTAAFFLTVNPAGNNLRLIQTVNNVAGNTLPAEPFFMYTTGQYNKGKINAGRSEKVGSSFTYSSSYDVGEGWTGGDLGTGVSSTYNLTNLRPYLGAGAPDPVVSVTAAGNAVNPRSFRIKLNGDSVLGQIMDYYDYVKTSRTAPVSLLTSGNASFQVTNLCTFPSDLMVVGKVEINYARLFNFTGVNNITFELPASTAGNYLVITGFANGGMTPIVYDYTNRKRYECNTSTPGQFKVALEPSALPRKLLMCSQSPTNVMKEITQFEQRNFINYQLAANQGDYLIITHPSLTGQVGGDDPVEDYRLYRSSPQGGSYNAKVFTIDQLEDQFGLGIKKHPLSIRNFIRWARANYSSPLKSILLIGKGVIYTQYRTNQALPDVEKLNLVPTFGNPASDNLLSAEGNSSMPLTPIGRISAISKTEIADYLAKVKQYEQKQLVNSPLISDKAWMKNIVHVTGASDNNTSDILLQALNGHKAIIEDSFFAGNVSTFTKNSADAVQQVSSARLEGLFKEGIGILTYFGHSSASTLEFNLDNPENYDNQGKYPVFIVMGCNAGSFYNYNVARFATKETISERFVLAKDRGAIAFFASTHLGIVHYLDIYNTRNYRAMSTNKYGATLGEIMDEAIRQVFVSTTENDFYARFQCEQFTLHGDPALKLYSFEKPDYVIEDPMVKVSPSFISVSDFDFKVSASFMNIGKAINKDVVIELKRTFPDNSVFIQKDTIPFTKFTDSLNYTFKIVPTRDKGLNKITVTIDAGNVIDELYETNNSITKEVYIIEDDVKPIFPYNYSIVSKQDIKLVASSADPFAPSHQYILEIDTTETFNSPFKVSRNMTSVGGVFEFSPGITFQDSTVYYWRVATAVASGTPKWNSASFVYLAGDHNGFNQSHYYQNIKSTTSRMHLLADNRRWSYDSVKHNIFLSNGVYGTSTTQEGDLIVSIDGDAFIRSSCVGYSLIFNLIDPNTFKVVENPNGRYGSALPCQPSRRWNFEYSYMTAASRKKIMDFMDSIPSGYYVAVRSINNNTQGAGGFINSWMADTALYGSGNSLYHKLQAAGFDKIDSLTKVRAFAFLYRNDEPSFTPKSVVSPGVFEVIKMGTDIKTTDTLGYVTSPLLGPAKSWQTLEWDGEPLETNDEVKLSVIGVDQNGAETELMTDITPQQSQVDVSTIDAAVYPYVKMKMMTKDLVNFTPYQLRYWRLYYAPVPEGAIAPNIYFSHKDTVGTGQSFNLGIAFKNVSNVNFDSLRVKVAITDKNNVEKTIHDAKVKPLAAGDTVRLDLPVDTKALQGSNTVFVNFNPDRDQPEQYMLNNFAFKKLYVIPDSLNPVMDVTFDGTHILNRDIVSARPKILIKLTDELRSLILDDTSLVSVSVRYPSGNTRRFYFNGSDTLQFLPASQDENTANVHFNPYFPEDGEYDLIVSGKDRSGNFAGNVQYKVSFTIINKPMISNMLNYPNPFTTSTAFVFTVTGSEVPQNIRIQVLTITGKIVREITKDELGPLHIGRNITEFKWDGTDQYGQKLANGIYLYRVITNLNGKALDKYKVKDDNTDQYFNKGYGKMYLMR